YSFISGQGTQTFTHFYKEKSIGDIEEVLRSFFCDTWMKYYANFQQKNAENENSSLFDLYSQIWGQDWYEKRVKELSRKNLERTLNILSTYGLSHPIEWLKSKVAETLLDSSK